MRHAPLPVLLLLYVLQPLLFGLLVPEPVLQPLLFINIFAFGRIH